MPTYHATVSTLACCANQRRSMGMFPVREKIDTSPFLLCRDPKHLPAHFDRYLNELLIGNAF